MRTKYNEHFDIKLNETEQHGSYIQSFLDEEVSYLLTPAATQISQVDFEDLYIHNRTMERQLERYVHHTNSNNICFLEGLTGVGKTMLVRHVFGIGPKKGFILDNTLVIPFSFNNALYTDVPSIFTNMVGKGCQRLEKSFPALKKAHEHPDELFDFIEEYREDLIAIQPKSRVEQLSDFYEKKPLAYNACVLKWYLSQYDACNIDNVVIVVDDIEGIRLKDRTILSGDSSESLSTEDAKIYAELLPVKMTLELIECMQNAGTVKWSLNTIICCRHYVSRMIKTCPFAVDDSIPLIQSLQAYAPCTRVSLEKSPPLNAIIRKRYEALKKNGTPLPRTNTTTGEVESRTSISRDKWENALEIVMQILNKVDIHMGDFILDLTLRNNREAMRWIKQVVFNKQWIQRNTLAGQNDNGAFEISDFSQYRITQASLIRAIGMNESTVYNSRASIIPNLLYNGNGQYGEMDMFPLLTLRFFVQKAKLEGLSWNNSYRVSNYMDAVHRLFRSAKYDEYFKKSVNYLLSRRLFLRSYDQDQFDNRSLNVDDLPAIEYVYVSSLATNMWQRMGATSVFFEMFIDDIWLDNDARNYMGRSNRIPYRGFDTVNYGVCLNYLESLIHTEKAIFSQAVNARSLNRAKSPVSIDEFFGAQPVCSHLLQGLESNLRAYYRLDGRPDEWQYSFEEKTLVDRWQGKIEELRMQCVNIYSKGR